MSTMLIVIVGQSNERGSGGAGTGSVTEAGPAHRDPISPNGFQYSMWPRLIDKLAKAGVRAILRNTARGSTSIAKTWCGMCRTWSATRYVASGEWCLPTTSNGKRYKSTGSSDVQTGATEPTWPTTNGQTVSDGGVTWTCFAADGSEADGKVYQSGESGFDPMGWFAALQAQAVGTFDRKVALVSIGQSDALCGTTRNQFRDGYINTARFLLAQGFEVFLGFTSSNSGYFSTFSTAYQPAIADAMAALAGTAKVYAGADLTAALGSAPPTVDGVHIVPTQLDLGGDAWFTAIAKTI
jgi:hypothetical protein